MRWVRRYPEAVRQLARWHTEYPGSLADSQWGGFKDWLILHGVEDEPDSDWDSQDKLSWCKSVADAFCKMYFIGDMLKNKPLPGAPL